jgi:hypothetical protein
MVMVQTIGMLKLNFKLLVTGNLPLFLIYFVALIQQIIFDHPYQKYVDEFIDREKNINSKSRAFKIVQDSHLNTYNAYRQIFNHSEILLKNKLERLEHRIIEYTNLWKQTNADSHNDQKTEGNHAKEALDVLTEQLIAENLEYGLLEYKEFRDKVGKVKDAVIKQMEDEKRQRTEQLEMENAEREFLEKLHKMLIIFH